VSQPLRIALIVPPRGWYARALLDGIASYSREHGPWRFVLQRNTEGNRVERWLRNWKPDGVLARIPGPNMARQLRDMRVPVVDLLEESGRSSIPRIVSDDYEVVRRAVDHLFDRHLRNVAYVGHRDAFFPRRRCRCFREYVSRRIRTPTGGCRGITRTSAHILLPWESMPRLREELAKWIRGLPKPVGIVACNDAWGGHVLQACNEAGFRVPDEVAVIGIDDDPAICQLSTPTLSSVGVQAHIIGYRAAAMLHGMITHGDSPPSVTFVEPGFVKARVSTDTLAIPDAHVVSIVRYLRAHACEHFTPRTAATALGMSLRTLERMFACQVGHSPAVEIMHARLEHAQQLLITTGLPMTQVANRTGFFHEETLRRVFKRRLGVTPGEYRRIHGAQAIATSRDRGQPLRRRSSKTNHLS
jgi:LacI family transcriptional regulator